MPEYQGNSKKGNLNRGPEGAYQIGFGTEETYTSNPSWIFFSSNVYQMEMLNKADFEASLPINAGEIFPIQPRIKLTYSDGSPIKGKSVVAFSWPEPEYHPDKGTNAFADAIKFAFMNNSISQPSDKNGIANFSNLTVLKFLLLNFRSQVIAIK